MKRFVSFGVLISFGLVLGATAALHAQTEEAVSTLNQLAQKPVAVAKLVEATGNPELVQELARSLNEGGVDPATFNQTLSAAAQTGSLEGITEVGTFVSQQVEDGVTGEELAQSIHRHLNEKFGIPAGRTDVQGPPPIAENFIPDRARNQIQSSRPPQPASARQPGPSNRPGSVGGPPGRSGPPAGVGSGNRPGPAGGGPGAGGPPSRPGAP